MLDKKLLKEFDELRDNLDTAKNHFNYAYNEEQIDAAIFELNTAEARLNNFLSRIWDSIPH